MSDPGRLPGRISALTVALGAAGRPREGFTVSVRVRADLERLRRVAPRLRDLGVDHVLVDHPDEDATTIRDRVAEMRAIVDPAAG